MKPCPATIAGARVICHTPIDERHRFTGNCRHAETSKAGGRKVFGQMEGLAICRYEDQEDFYLFGCSSDWECFTDTLHPTPEDAKAQAEFEYAGVGKTWTSND